MSEVCEYFKLPHAVEPAKKYVRDWKTPGRIRVRLIREDGTFEHAEIQSRKLVHSRHTLGIIHHDAL
jgi:signal recognition particle subunit SRP19